jgi:hypothetical protein
MSSVPVTGESAAPSPARRYCFSTPSGPAAADQPNDVLADGGRYLVFAAKAGSATNPDWYWNLRANPDATIEVGDETIAVRAPPS